MASDTLSLTPAKKNPGIGVPVYVLGALAVVGLAVFGYMQYAAKHQPTDAPLTPEAK